MLKCSLKKNGQAIKILFFCKMNLGKQITLKPNNTTEIICVLQIKLKLEYFVEN